MSFQFDPTRPIYLQIVEEVKKRSVRGEYVPGARLPSVRELSTEMGVNPNTMARAYMELEREGFIFTKRGQGSFVANAKGRVDEERRQLAEMAMERFVAEVRELDLGAVQRKALMNRLREELR